jgi:hypothetical protein
MQKQIGLFYENLDGEKILYHSYYNEKELIRAIDSDEFKAIEKTRVYIVDMRKEVDQDKD